MGTTINEAFKKAKKKKRVLSPKEELKDLFAGAKVAASKIKAKDVIKKVASKGESLFTSVGKRARRL